MYSAHIVKAICLDFLFVNLSFQYLLLLVFQIIDPFVEVEVIGLPVDCFKEQTRVVDDNGFNPMWEETLVFTVHMPEIALIRFLVWDHDPIGRDFIGQRTIAFSSMMPGYRHVYLEGIEEASIFVHVAINDICGKVSVSVVCNTSTAAARILYHTREAQWVKVQADVFVHSE